MKVTDRDRNRLKALTLLIRPPHSIAARIEMLSEDHRAIYDNYSERMSQWIARNDVYTDDESKGRAYELVAQGYGPRLPDAINAALHGPRVTIPITATDDQAQQMWNDQR